MSTDNGQNQAQNTEQTQNETVQVDWRSKIPEAHKDKGFWNNVKDEGDLYNQFAELQRYRGQSIKVPGESATNEDWNSIYAKLGRPESPEQYEIKLRDHDGQIQWAEGSEAWVKETAHELGLNNRQTQKLVDKYGELILSGATEQAKQQNARIEELRDQFGDRYERNVTMGERALHKLGGDELVEYAQARGWNADPVMVRAMMKLGGIYEEQSWIDGKNVGMGKAEAQAKLREIQANMSHPYWIGHDPGHDAALKEVQRLEDIVYGV